MHRPNMRRAVALLVIGAWAAAAAGATAQPPAAAAATGEAAGGETAAEQAQMERHVRRIDDVRRTAESLLGPLPAVATTPFFGLAALTAAGLFAESDAVRGSRSHWAQAFRDNALIREARRYASWPLLLTLLGLALVTYLANAGKVGGVAGKLLRVIEDSSSALVYFALSLGALHLATAGAAGAGGAGNVGSVGRAAAGLAGAAVGRMGALSGWADTLVALGLAMGLAAMMVTRYACDVMIWLVPIPFVDFAFETLKKILTVGFMLLYVFAPGAAAVMALLLVVPAVLLSPWALRIVSFAFHVLLRPPLAYLMPGLRPVLLDTRLADRFAVAREGLELATEATALAVRGVPTRTRGALLRTADGVCFMRATAFGRRRAHPLPGPALPGGRLRLVRSLLWSEVRVEDTAGNSVARFAVPRSLDFDRLRVLLAAEDGRPAPTGADAARQPGAAPAAV